MIESRDLGRYTQKEINDLIWIIRSEKNDRTGEENIKRNVLKAEWRKFMNFVFQLDMCTCGGWERNFVSFSEEQEDFNNSFVFVKNEPFGKYSTDILSPAVPPKGSPTEEANIIKVYHCLTQIFLSWLKSRGTKCLSSTKMCFIIVQNILERNNSTECLFHLMMTTESLS